MRLTNMIGFVLAGGYGKRLLPLTSITPKPFIQLVGRRLYEYSHDQLRGSGVNEVVIVVPPNTSNMAREGAPADVVEQRGSDIQGALRTAYEELSKRGDDVAVVAYTGFISSPAEMAKLAVDFFESNNFPAVIALASVATGLETYGFVTIDYRGAVQKFMWESKEAKSWSMGRGYVFGGIMVCDRRSLKELSERPFAEAMNSMASQGQLGGVVWPGKWIEIGYPWDLLEAIPMLLPSGATISEDAQVSSTAVIGRGVVIDRGAVIEDGAIIKGPAYIGRFSKVLSGAVVGGFSSVEQGAYIGENSVIIGSYIGPGARVGALAEVRRSVVGERATVGEGSHLVDYQPTELPERLRWLAQYLGEGVTLGAVVGPGYRVPCCTSTGGGTIIA